MEDSVFLLYFLLKLKDRIFMRYKVSILLKSSIFFNTFSNLE